MIKKGNHSRRGWLALMAIAGVSLLGGIMPSASASDRSTKTALSCCKRPMRTPCSCCVPVTSRAARAYPALTESRIAKLTLAPSRFLLVSVKRSAGAISQTGLN